MSILYPSPIILRKELKFESEGVAVRRTGDHG
jgi:hypothetical protein